MLSLEIFNIIVYVWIGIAIVIFLLLLKVTAPYGRHTKTNWGPMMNNRLGWFFMELPALVVFSWFLLKGDAISNPVILIIFILWFIHYFHRTIIYPLRIRTKKKKMPVLIVSFAVFFNFVNGFVNGYWFGVLSPDYPMEWIRDPRFITGVSLFVTGFIVNQYHDKILIGLRKKNNGEYIIPLGGMFRYISCPNFFGEIIQWGGFALMTWCLPSFSFFLWTFVNLVPRALDHHKWYKQHFDEYPKNRKAIFPFMI